MTFVEQPLHEVVEKVRERSPTPGGGTVAALVGVLGSALGSMAVRFTQHRKGTSEEVAKVCQSVDEALGDLVVRLEALADEDSAAYERVRDARRLPRGTDAEKATRREAVQAAVAEAAGVPLRTARLCREGLEVLEGLANQLNPNLATDAASGALLLRAACRGALYNVEVNLLDLSDVAECARLEQECEAIGARVQELEGRLLEWAEGALRS